MPNYIFTLRPDLIDIANISKPKIFRIDCFTELPNSDEVEFEILSEDASKLFHIDRTIFSIKMRMRMNQDMIQSIFKVNMDCEIDADILQDYINNLKPSDLEAFLTEAKIKI